jgi:ketosteroid isomerase-like protein
MSTEDDPGGRKLAEAVLDALAQQDRGALESVLTEDVRWWFPQTIALENSLPRPAIGQAACVPVLIAEKPAFATTTWHYLHVVQEGDLVAAHVERESTTASGLPYRVEYHWLLQVRGGKVSEVWDVMDTKAALDQFFAEQ